MYLLLFLQAFLVGVIVTAPVGPVGVLVIRRTLRVGSYYGILTGFGAAMADTTFAATAALGLSFVSGFFQRHEMALAFSGSTVLFIMGYFFLKKMRQEEAASESDFFDNNQSEVDDDVASSFLFKLFKGFFSGYVLTITNAMTIVGFGVIFTQLHFGGVERGALSNLLIIGGVFLGALTWWVFLSLAVGRIGRKLSKSWIFRIQISLAWLVIISALAILLRGLYKLF